MAARASTAKALAAQVPGFTAAGVRPWLPIGSTERNVADYLAFRVRIPGLILTLSLAALPLQPEDRVEHRVADLVEGA